MDDNRSDLFWADDINVLYHRKRLIEFFPTNDMSPDERLNAIARLSIYAGIVLFLYRGELWPLYIPIVGLAFTLFLHKTSKTNRKNSKDENNGNPNDNDGVFREESESPKGKRWPPIHKKCTTPTRDNPFMNITVNEYLDDPVRSEACDQLDPKIKEDLEDHFNYNLYKDVDDLFGKNNSQRQFYTTAITTNPNDQISFAKWLYSVPATCKEDSSACYRYSDLRSNSPTFGDYQLQVT